ncbi:MAG TPA: NAD-dependent epimerase/dehydratase family protein [Acidimicrobiales bacterium]
MGKRVLVTGLGTFWGGRVAQALEQDPDVETIVGLDTREPSVELRRTEFVRTDENYSILARIVRATEVDTIVHTFLVLDSSTASGRQMNETNVIGTMNLLAAAGSAGSTVRNVVVKSATLVYGSSIEDPVWFKEETPRSNPPKLRVEQSVIETEGYLRDFAEDNPHVVVSLLRFSNVLGTEITTSISKCLQLPVVPSVLGFDPRFQFVHESDVIRSILYVMDHQLPGVFNVAGDGLLPWSEVAAMCGKRTVPLPPVGIGVLGQMVRRFGIDLPPELLVLLRYGRGVDNRRLTRSGFRYHYTSAGTVQSFNEAVRLRRTVGEGEPDYIYERDVENFFRHSPAVVKDS